MSRRRRQVFDLLELLSAVGGLAAIPLLALALFTEVKGIGWFLAGWLLIEVGLLVARPALMRGSDDYTPPRGRVP